MSERETLTAKTYASAFSCIMDQTCPQANGESGCPMWLEYIDVLKDDDGLVIDKRRLGGCAPVVLYKINAESSNRTVLAHNKAEQARAAAEGVADIFAGARKVIREATSRRIELVNQKQIGD